MHEISDLLWLCKSAASSIADCPASLLLGLEFSMLKQMYKRRDEIRIDDRLDLIAVTRGDIGYSPACFLSNGLLST